MKTSQIVGPRTSAVIDVDLPRLGVNDVLVEIVMCGVCASELPGWRETGADVPFRLGHEPFGLVIETGAGVNGLQPGDRVTGLFGQAYSTHGVVPASLLVRVPEKVADDAGLGEPLACLVNAVRRTPIALADTLVIVGLGYMGLGFLQVARLRGPSRIVAIDVRQESLERALALGAHEAYTPDTVPDDLYLTRFGDWETSRGADVVVEASGTQAGLDLAGQLVKAHGVLSIVGYHQGMLRQVDVGMWNWKAIDVVNAHVRRRDDLLESMRMGLEMERTGQIAIGAMISHRFSLDQVDEAFRALESKPDGFVKAIIVP